MATEKTFHRQIMEAGFGDLLIRNGFEKASPVFYKRIYPLFEVHVTASPMYPKHNGPRSFYVSNGIFFPQLRPVYEAYATFDKFASTTPWELDMRNKTSGCHIVWHVEDQHMTVCRPESLKDEFKSLYHDQTRKRWFTKAQPTWHKLFHVHKDSGPTEKYFAWVPREERSLEAFTEEFGSYWQLQYNEFANQLQDTSALAKWILKYRIGSVSSFSPQAYAMLWALGHPKYLESFCSLLLSVQDIALDDVKSLYLKEAEVFGLGAKNEALAFSSIERHPRTILKRDAANSEFLRAQLAECLGAFPDQSACS